MSQRADPVKKQPSKDNLQSQGNPQQPQSEDTFIEPTEQELFDLISALTKPDGFDATFIEHLVLPISLQQLWDTFFADDAELFFDASFRRKGHED